MSASGARNRTEFARVWAEAMMRRSIAEGYTGKPDLPCVNTGEAAKSGWGNEKHATYSILFESYLFEHGKLPQGC